MSNVPKNVDPRTGEVKEGQLILFEDHAVRMIEKKLKAGSLSVEAGGDSDDPKLYETRYFVVKAKAVKVDHADKDLLLTKTVHYEVGRTAEVDEFTAERLLMTEDEE